MAETKGNVMTQDLVNYLQRLIDAEGEMVNEYEHEVIRAYSVLDSDMPGDTKIRRAKRILNNVMGFQEHDEVRKLLGRNG